MVALPSVFLLVVILHHDEQEVVVWHHHELTLLSPHPHESHVIAGVHLLEHADGLVYQGAEDVAVLTAGGGVQCGLDGHPLLIR